MLQEYSRQWPPLPLLLTVFRLQRHRQLLLLVRLSHFYTTVQKEKEPNRLTFFLRAGSLVVSQAAEVYGSSRSSMHSSSSSSDVEVLGERRPIPATAPAPALAPLPTGVPREPSPPPKPDGSECHRSQSAIFTRMWNRGEGNSCSRTDMVFKPVPNSKLARKREERLRKASEREVEMRNADHAKRAAQEMANNLHHMAGIPGHPGLFNPAMAAAMSNPSLHAAMAASGAGRHPSPFPPAASPVVSAAPPPSRTPGAAGDSPSPLAPPPPHAPRPLGFPPGFAPAPAPSPHPSLAAIQAQAADTRRRQYEESVRMTLATDPLLRLQMAGVTPEIPGVPHGHFRHANPFLPPGICSKVKIILYTVRLMLT